MKTRQRFAAFGIAACVAATSGPAAFGESSASGSDAAAAVSSAPKRALAQSAEAPPPPGTRQSARDNKVCVRESGRKVCRRYAVYYRYFGRGNFARGAAGSFSVHSPKDLGPGRMHSLAELSLHKPGALGTYIEVGWRRERGDRPRLFVFRWNHDKPSCYNLCGGFKARGPGKRPGSPLRPGSTIHVAWRHHHHRWNLYVNGKWSGFYPDRLFNGTFTRVRLAQYFGEVAFFKDGRGRCVDMGNGRFAGPRSARVFKISFFGTSARPRGAYTYATAPKMYNIVRTSPRSFQYGGPGPC